MNGLGVMIWQLASMYEPAKLADFLATGGVKWVSIKVLNGPNLYNAKGGNQKLLKEYWAALKGKGIEVGGWQYVYGDQPGAEGDAASAFYEEFHPDNWLIDAEGEYKRYGAAKAAKVYCAKIHKGENYLCSYRFPSLHGGLIKPFPFSAFLNADKMIGAAPQVYWVGAHDVAVQIERSISEYKKLTGKPIIPIGSAFGAGDWEPTVNDLNVFVQTCKTRVSAYGFYSLDWILKNRRFDWWEAITGVSVEPPTPPAPGDIKQYQVMVDKLNFRNSPVVNSTTDVGDLKLNGLVNDGGEDSSDGKFRKIWGWAWKESLKEIQ